VVKAGVQVPLAPRTISSTSIYADQGLENITAVMKGLSKEVVRDNVTINQLLPNASTPDANST
jgi:hypothetical protein